MNRTGPNENENPWIFMTELTVDGDCREAENTGDDTASSGSSMNLDGDGSSSEYVTTNELSSGQGDRGSPQSSDR